ncbi:MAG: co-chaperone DjlA [Gammaproteobacteria bacterium]|nr:co-chaperone DjlA [Gammaproteobacteria bacterium]MCW8988868.1 co-chaperone DjlA [Gammaproteobacteria bacterium]
MNFGGKLAGAFFGYLLTGGSLIGALIGFYFGHLFDRGLAQGDFSSVFNTVRNKAEIQQIFFKTVFSLLGHVAKADGHVSSEEIQAARTIMQQMRLDEAQSKRAIEFFTAGKQVEFYPDRCINEFREISHHNRALSQMLLEILIFAALADGKLDINEERILLNLSEQIGFSRQDYQRLVQMVMGQQHFHQSGSGQAHYQQQSTEDALKEAYAVLGVADTASDSEVKKAYRRQMNEHHPDKLVSKGMPEEMVKMATEKTQEIKAAYELIVSIRKK